MKDFLIQVEKITGVADSDRACSVFTKRVSVSDGSVGTVVAGILARQAKSSSESDLQSDIGDVFDLLVKKLEGGSSGMLEVLEFAKNTAINYAKERNIELSFVYTFIFQDVCYIAKFGDSVKLLVFEPPKSLEITFESGSGPVKHGQIYLVATKKFLSIFDTGDLKQDAEIDFVDIIDGIATEIAGEKEQSEIGAAFVSIKGGEEGTKGTDVGDSGQEETERIDESQEDKGEVGETDDSEGQRNKETEATGGTEGTDVYQEKIEQASSRKSFLNIVFGEFAKLRHGDLGAVVRLRRKVVVLAALIILILVGSVLFTLKQKSDREKAVIIDGYLASASSKLDEGAGLIELNKVRAREVLVEADRYVKQAMNVDPKNQKAKSLVEKITSKLKETEVSSNINFSTVSEVSDQLVDLSTSVKNLIAVADGKIFVVNTKTGDKTDVDGISGASGGVAYDDKAFLTTSSKVVRIDLSNGQAKDVIDSGGANDIGVFLGNVYLLFPDKINKYVPVEGGSYSGPTEYLNNPMSFGAKSRFAIDGSVWVTSGKQIFKFTRGEKQNFEISGLIDGVGDFGSIYTNSSLDNLYVVDTTNSALLVISKDGIYKKVYQAPEFAKAAGVVVGDAEDEMYVAVGNKILSAKL